MKQLVAATKKQWTARCPGLPGWAATSKVKPIWILLKQEIVSGSDISWAICKSALRSRQITMPTPAAQFFTGRMPFLPPNQQRQSTEGLNYKHWLHIDTRCVHVSVERQWLPPRSAHHRNADCDLFTARHTVVRRGNCSLYQPHSQSHSWIRMRCTWRETEIPWCAVSLQISYL